MNCLLRWTCALFVCGALSACGDDSGDGSDAGQGPIDPVSQEINADEGGTIETTGASITIPAGALSEDTAITVEVLLSGVPDADKVASLVYDFGPDGTEFNEPVELTIALNKSVPDGMEAKLAWYDEEAEVWTPLADSKLQGDEVTATTTHFTLFAIVLTSSGQVAGSCEDFDTFEACGGDITGTWEFSLACADVTAEDLVGDLFGDCPDLTVAIDVDISGTATFEADGDYSSAIMRDIAFELRIPTSCLPMGAMCSDLQESAMPREVDGACVLAMSEPGTVEEETGTYELSGSELIMMDSAETEADEPQQYCVRGDTITVRNVSVDEETGAERVMYIQATRR